MPPPDDRDIAVAGAAWTEAAISRSICDDNADLSAASVNSPQMICAARRQCRMLHICQPIDKSRSGRGFKSHF
jgi:hypothetical protein